MRPGQVERQMPPVAKGGMIRNRRLLQWVRLFRGVMNPTPYDRFDVTDE